MIRGWGNYYRHVVAKQVFGYIDNSIYLSIAKWVKRRHPRKNAAWWRKEYFRRERYRNWIFSAKKTKNGVVENVDLCDMQHIPIKRHVKIRADATPYDPAYREYFEERCKTKRKSCIRFISELFENQKDKRLCINVRWIRPWVFWDA